MINFIDEYGKQHAAIVECQKTKGVNGEKSLSGTIYTNDEILEGIGRGWRLQFEEENYCLTYVNPIDEGNRIVVEFDAVHEFFFDLRKSVIYSEMNGSNTANAYLQFIFNGSGYEYRLEVTIPSFEKESFGMKNRLDLFKDFISSTGVEFSVNGKIVRILERVGTNLSTIVKKGFNLNELRIERDPGSFITYLRGYGAFFDPDDESKGRLIVEYLSPLAELYGKLEGDPIVDERYKVESNFIDRLKNDVESSYGISVDIDMEDLTKAGYEYDQPHEGDYIMAINKDLGFEQKIRIMSYTTSYDTEGNIIDHDVSCGSDNIIQKNINEENEYRKEVQAGLENAISTANQAWISADGKNQVFQGPDRPTNANKGDIWYQIDGEQTIMNYWNGFDWVPFINPDAVKESVDQAKQAGEQAQAAANQATEDAQAAKAKADAIQIDVNSLVSDVATINGNVTAISSKANEAYSKAQAVEGKTVSLENTVNGFSGRLTDIETVSDATTKKVNELEVTVDGQKQTLATVQTTANSALSKSNTLSTDVDSMKITLTSVKDWQNDFQVGGRNLLRDSELPDRSTISSNDSDRYPITKTVMTEGSRNFIRIKRYNPTLNNTVISLFSGIAFTSLTESIINNGPITVSFAARAQKPSRWSFMAYYFFPQTDAPNKKDLEIGTTWKRYSITFNSIPEGATAFRVNPQQVVMNSDIDMSTFYLDICEYKVERGSIATDWDPAPEDKAQTSKVNQIESTVNGTVQTVASVKTTADSALTKATQVETTANGLKTTISSVETTASNALTKATQVEATASGIRQTVTEVQTDLNNLDINDRNLFVNSTQNLKSITINGWNHYPNGTTYKIPVTEGEIYTVRAYITDVSTTGTGVGVKLFWYNSAGTIIRESPNPKEGWIPNGGRGYCTLTDNAPGDAVAVTVAIRNSNYLDSTLKYKELKLQKGNKATLWTPAPEDMATSSQFTQLSDTINFKVSKGDVINQINVSTESILISGNKVHITGQTTIDNGVIKNAQIADLSVSTAKIANAAITDAKIGSLSATKITTGTLNAANVNIINLNANSITTGTISGTNLSINLATGEVIFNKGIIKNLDDTFQMNITTGVTASRGEYLSPNDTGNTLAAGYNLMNGKIEFYTGTFGEATVSYGGLTTETHSGQYKENGIWQAGMWSGNRPAIALKMANPNTSVWQSVHRAVLLSSTEYQEPFSSSFFTDATWLGYGDKSGADTKQNIRGAGIGVKQSGSDVNKDESGGLFSEAWVIARHGVYLASGYAYDSTISGRRYLAPTIRLGTSKVNSGASESIKQMASTATITAGYKIAMQSKYIDLRAGDSGGITLNAQRTDINGGGDSSSYGGISFGADSNGARVWSKSIYNKTYSSGPQVCVTSYGTLGRITSARKYKMNIQVANKIVADAKKILEINPVSWIDKFELSSGNVKGRYYGFIADEFHEKGMTEVVFYDEKGQVEGLAYDRLTMYHNVILSDHEREVQLLKQEVEQLKIRIQELEAA
ncbi:protein gp18 [Enterococcus saccharolyticus]|uniref:phage tail protein n=1 Tax=Enterococcus saccharolyticus TaxID=41997 RepID=UPI0010256AD3|nr:phage tail protein [Enterococcus saccharolyticus]VFA64477.1 protein gp18 [Enterococcus saccharolyticus]